MKRTIPLIDIRDSSLIELTRAQSEQGRALLADTCSSLGALSRALSEAVLPIGDKKARAWLEKSRNPYLAEIDAYADALKVNGVYALNLSYEWGCTSGVFTGGDFVRVLDWPFSGLGEHLVVLRQKGVAGEFFNIGWLATSGIFQALAPGRFAAAINQAPMRRHGRGYVLDWAKNRTLAFEEMSLPPAHLLRQVCEQAGDYAEAKRMLTETPISLPVIYILGGVTPGEGCVIERTETIATIFELGDAPNVVAANHFREGKGWRKRTWSSPKRARCLGHLAEVNGFDWFKRPVANHLTRLALVANPAQGTLRLMGTHGARPVTEIFTLP